MQAYTSPELLPQRAPTSGSEMPTATQQQSTQTSLPPIRLLHPFLDPPSGMSQHMGPSSTSYEYPSGTTHYPPLPQPPMSDTHPPLLKREPQPEIYGGVDSEAEGYDSQHGPQGNAKRKRRRQALSCTECKRRKIKCDRNQPCAPCTRRSEQAKCQWHIVEPVEKYVTRAEYEELKARFDQLSELVHRLLASQSMPYYQSMSSQPQPGPSVEAAQPYQGYPSMLPPQHTYQPHLEHGPPSVVQAGPSHRYSRLEDAQSPVRTIGPAPASSPAIPTIQSPLQSRSHPPGPKSPAPAGATTARRSPHSLASITSTYNTEPSESKNYPAQTLKLGERLRRDPSRALEDSALLFIVPVRLLRLPVLTLPPFRECLWMAHRLLANHTIFTHRDQVGG